MGYTFVTHRWSRLVSAVTILTLPFVAHGQRRDRWRDPPTTTHVEQTGQFVFTRIRYGGARSTWSHDYPRADLHLPRILDDLTTIEVHLGNSNVFRLDGPESATERELVTVTSSFTPPRRGEIPHGDVTRDVNGDDRDDLVVPDVDGFWVFVQTSDGAFADPMRIGPP